MAVYVDGERNNLGRMVMCHMLADTSAELHAMADAIGMKRACYQSPDKASFPHYDLSLARRLLAVARGAKQITRRECADFMKSTEQRLIAQGHTWATVGW